MSNVKVKVTEYKGYIVIETVNPTEKHKDFLPAGGSNLGCILSHCSKDNLGISKEGFELLGKVRRGRDDLGEIDIFGAQGANVIFGWLGGAYKIANPKDSECTGSNSYDASLLKGNYSEIENEAPQGAKEAIENIEA
jgi:hypothetical protein